MERIRIRRHTGGWQRRKDLTTGSQQQDERDRKRRAHCTDQALAASTPE